MKQTYDVTLVNRLSLSQNTLRLDFSLHPEGRQNFKFKSGQFIQLFLPIDGTTHRRSYSVCNSPEDFEKTGILHIVISHVAKGIASDFFAQTPLGSHSFKMAGPFGVLTLPDEIPNNLLLIGTGTGIAPYNSMLPDLKRYEKNTSIFIISGFRSYKDAIFNEAFASIKNIDYRVCYSREPHLKKENNEYKGYVQHQFDNLNLDASKDIVFLCGNPMMIDDCVSILKGLSFTSKQLKREKYIYSGHKYTPES